MEVTFGCMGLSIAMTKFGMLLIILNLVQLQWSVHEMASRPLAQFDLILAWASWKCERLTIIMKYTNIQFCERLGHGWQFHPLMMISL